MNQIIKYHLLWNKFNLDKTLCVFIVSLLLYGIFMTWSASGQNYEIIQQKILQVLIGLFFMLLFAQIPPRVYEYWTPYIYYLSIILLILVNIFGQVSKGAQRWVNLGCITFQPSEMVKVSVLLMMIRYINNRQYPLTIQDMLIVLFFVIVPIVFILLQPDLGTAILIGNSGLFVLFLSGINWKLIGLILLLIFLFIPIFWCFCMHEYQKDRIVVLLHPETDPLGSGYHIIQSKIAIGSGGLTGKGWLQGTQSQLEFLPERHTDFIFSVIGEELGFIGILILLMLYLLLIFRGFFLAISIKNTFGRLFISSFMLILFMNVVVNISMVSGILPIVGIPLPLISYGGSSLLVLMIGFGMIMSMYGYRKTISTVL